MSVEKFCQPRERSSFKKTWASDILDVVLRTACGCEFIITQVSIKHVAIMGNNGS